jgi:hypothetical protein
VLKKCITADGQRLWDSFRLNFRSAATLGLVARLAYPFDLYPGQPYGQEPGLSLIVRHALHFDLPKQLQQSEWDSENLSDAQKDCTLPYQSRGWVKYESGFLF